MKRQSVSNRDLLGVFLAIQFEFVSESDAQSVLFSKTQDASAAPLSALASSSKMSDDQVGLIEHVVSTLATGGSELDLFLERFIPASSEWPRELLSGNPQAHRKPDASTKIQPATDVAETALHTPEEIVDSHGSDDLSLATYLVSDSQTAGGGTDETTLASAAGLRYDLTEPLAEGGLGCVSVAIDREFNRKVALKQIKPKYLGDSNSQRRFIFEAEITGLLEHPSIIPVYSLGCDANQQPFYAMRLIEGDSLRDAIRRFHNLDTSPTNNQVRSDGDDLTSDDTCDMEPECRAETLHSPRARNQIGGSTQDSSRVLEFRQLLAHFVDLCNAIDFAHNRGIIHRDIKPANVMVGPFGETIVLDWGLARRVGDAEEAMPGTFTESSDDTEHTRTGSIVGTLVYMAPEQAAGETGSVGPQSDIYSLGATLYELLTGQNAFSVLKYNSREDMLGAVKSGEFAPPAQSGASVPGPLNAVCLKAMSAHPNDRYGSARELAQDIDRWLADEPVSAWREPVSIKARRWLRQHRALVTASVTVLMTALVGLAVIATLQNESNRKLTAANTQVSKAKQIAERQFDLAVKAIGQYHTGVTSDFLLGQTEFQELRNSLIVGPRDFYRELLAIQKDVDDPTYEQRLALVESHIQLGVLASDVNDQQAALAEYETVLELVGTLADDFPEKLDLLEIRGRTSLNQASAFLSIGEYTKSESSFKVAIETFDSLKKLDPQYPLVDAMLALHAYQYALLLTESSRYEEAAEFFSTADKSYRKLLEQNPDDRELKSSLSTCLSNWSNMEWDQGKIDSAITRAEKGLEMQVKLRETGESNMADTYAAAGTMTNLAYLYQEKGKNDLALEMYTEAESAFQQLVRKAPNVVRFQNGLASTLTNLGLLYVAQKDRANAEEVYRDALKIKERIVQDSPESVDYVVSLAGGYVNFGGLLHGFGEYEPALEWYGKAVELLDDLLKQQPDHARARMFKRNVHLNRSKALRNLRRFREAADDLEQAIEFSLDPDELPSLRNQRLQSLAQCERHAEGSRLADEAMEAANSDADFYNLAFIQALAVGTVAADNEMPEPDRTAALKLYTSRAVRALRAMYETEALNEEQFLNLLENNPYLKSLHDQQEYRGLADEFK